MVSAETLGELQALPLPSTLIASQDLLNLDLPEIEFVVPQIVPQGVTVLVGKPLSGKSWLALELAVEVARGQKVLGSIPVKQGGAVYFQLRGGIVRFKTRLGKLLGPDAHMPELLHLGGPWEPLKRLNNGGLEQIEEILYRFSPDLRLLVLDPFTEIRPLPATRTSEAEALAELQFLALAYKVAIIVISPFEIDGADATAALEREGGSNRATLTVKGADLEEDTGFTLRFDKTTGRWVIAGDLGIFTLTEGRAEILEAVRRAGKSLTPLEVAQAVGKHPQAVRQTMARMSKRGQLRRLRRGLYTLPIDKKRFF